MRAAIRQIIIIVALPVAGARGQAISTPNQIVGIIRFTNSNPEIVAELHDRAQATVMAASVGHAPALTHATGGTCSDFSSCAYEMTVESGTPGIVYNAQALLTMVRPSSYGTYLTNLVRSAPVLPEPAPDVAVDILSCAGLIVVRWQYSDGSPAAIQSGSIRVMPRDHLIAGPLGGTYQAEWSIEPHATEQRVVARGDGGLYTIETRYTSGTDPFHDTVTMEDTQDVHLYCDQTTPLTIIVPAPPPTGTSYLPRIIGLADVIGEAEHLVTGPDSWQTLLTDYGPYGNVRLDQILAEPSSGAYELENLVPSDVEVPPVMHRLYYSSSFRVGRRHERFSLGRIGVYVPLTGTLDLDDLFVADSAYMSGDIILAGPPPEIDASPTLSSLVLADPAATNPESGLNVVALMVGSDAIPPDPSRPIPPLASGGAVARVDGAFDTASDRFSGDYELVVGGHHRRGSTWMIQALGMTCRDTGLPIDPERYAAMDASVSFQLAPFAGLPPIHLDAGQRSIAPLHACMSQVNLDVISHGGLFYAPRVEYSRGAFDGIDFEGHASRIVTRLSRAEGTPLDAATASSRGRVNMALPTGDYALKVYITSINPGGGSSDTQVPDVGLHVGCRQVLVASNVMQVNMDDVVPCASDGFVHVTGRVHADAGIASIAWSASGGAETEICRACGIDRPFSADLAVGPGTTTVRVRAVDADGNEASATGFTTRAGEPSALDIDPSRRPLTVTRPTPGTLRLEWEDTGQHDYTVHAGTIRSLHGGVYDHGPAPGGCGIADTWTLLAEPTGSAYFLVTEPCAFGDGSFGRNSFRRERPHAIRACH